MMTVWQLFIYYVIWNVVVGHGKRWQGIVIGLRIESNKWNPYWHRFSHQNIEIVCGKKEVHLWQKHDIGKFNIHKIFYNNL